MGSTHIENRFRSLIELAEREAVHDPTGPTCRALIAIIQEMASEESPDSPLVYYLLARDQVLSYRFDALLQAVRELWV